MSFSRFFLISLILFSSCSSKKQNPNITWLYGYGHVEKLNGRVKILVEKRINGYKFDPVYTFDRKGDLIAIILDAGDTAKHHTEYINGKKRAAKGIYFENGKKFENTYVYNENGYIAQCIRKNNRLLSDTDRFIYNKAGNLVGETTYFNKQPTWVCKFKYFYDQKLVCTSVEHMMATRRGNFKDSVKDTTRYIAFDSYNNWIKSVDFLNDTVTRKITYY